MEEATVWAVMDRMRETQLQHGAVLDMIQKQLDLLAKPQIKPGGDLPSKINGWLTLLKPIGAVAAQYGASLLVLAYVLKGGDALTAVSALLKLL